MRVSLRFVVLVPTLFVTSAQTPPTGPNGTIRVDVNLVQVDAVVTDAHGQRVPGLQAADFELLQDGKKQTITNLSYIAAPPHPAARSAVPVKTAKGEVPPPPTPLPPAAIGRVLALLVDDQGIAGENIGRVRGALKNFIDEEMRPGDLVAIVRTSAGMGALQQFTAEKRLLYQAFERVKPTDNRVGFNSFWPLGPTTNGNWNPLKDIRSSLAAIRFVVNSMAGLPGRKSVVLFTEDIRLISGRAVNPVIVKALQQLTDAAARASVVINAIDTRALATFIVSAMDNTGETSAGPAMTAGQIALVAKQRQALMNRTQDGMFELADQTGGLFLHDVNDLSDALRRVAEDGDAYYLIGYHPDAETFAKSGTEPKFHRLEVRTTRPVLHVRTRNGFFGTPPDAASSPEEARETPLTHAFESPYAGVLHPRLTAFFDSFPNSGSFVNAFLYFDPRDWKWSTEPDGSRKASVEVAAAAFDDNGAARGLMNTRFPLRLDGRQYAEAVRKGMVYAVHIPIAKPGPYLVRAALRDPATEATGSAEQFVEVPNLAAGRLALSGIVVQQHFAQTAATAAPTGPAIDFTNGGARRVFPGSVELDYYYDILNAVGPRPDLETQTRLFHDGAQIGADKAVPDTSKANPTQLRASGRLRLRSLAPGAYALQVIVTDKLSKGKLQTATQSVDFEID